MMTRLHDDERGMAMVVALLTVFIVLILSTVVIDQAMHNTQQSGRARDRVLSVDASEGGLDWFYAYLQNTKLYDPLNGGDITSDPFPAAYVATSPNAAGTVVADPKNISLGTAPATSNFTATAVYYDADGLPMDPSKFTNEVYPSSVYIKAVGTVDGGRTRTMESFVNLTPIRRGNSQAIYSLCGLDLVNNLTLNRYETLDADIYVASGDVHLKNQPVIFGSVFAAGKTGMGCPTETGNIWLEGNSNVRGNVWAKGSILIDNPAAVTGNALSSTSSITVTSKGPGVGGNATALGVISPVPAPNSYIAGTATTGVNSGDVPTYEFPKICWDDDVNCIKTSGAWEGTTTTPIEDKYKIEPKSCAEARAYILSSPTPPVGFGGIVVHITDAVCALDFSKTNVTLNGNLAIFTNGSISFSQSNDWKGPANTTRTVQLISDYSAGVGQCSTPPTFGAHDISTSQNTDFGDPKIGSTVNVLFYTPCNIYMDNQNTNFGGQVLGGRVFINNQFTLNFFPVYTPGAGEIVGFDEDIAYIREVAG